MRIGKKILLFLIFIACSGCSTLQPPMSDGIHVLTWTARQRQLQEIGRWQVGGALGVQYANQSSMSHFTWQQTAADNYQITITSTLDIGGVKITGNKQQVTLWRSATDKVTAKTAEQLMVTELGWSLPLNNLKSWVVGLPVAKIPYKAEFDAYNHLSLLEQQGWTIKYAAYKSISNIDLPTKIWLTNSKLRAKIVINRWRLQ
ncbi:MAG: outer membrane lipoprotein LolB [Gammaproteobacteria bacterium]|nr:outer membrane lipoprotein LolB [Gammaproteobacteria bacterium]